MGLDRGIEFLPGGPALQAVQFPFGGGVGQAELGFGHPRLGSGRDAPPRHPIGRRQFGVVALEQRYLFALHREPPLKHPDPLSVACHESFSHRHRLLIAGFGGESAPAFGIGQLPLLGVEFPLGARQGVPQGPQRHLGLDHGTVESSRRGAGVGDPAGLIEQSLEAKPQLFKCHARAVLAEWLEPRMSRQRGEASSEGARYLPAMRPVPLALLLGLIASGCAERGGSTVCGIVQLASPAVILEQFTVPRQTLSFPPRSLPEEVAVRFAAGPVVRGLVGITDSLMVVGVDEPMPGAGVPGFGVVVTDLSGGVQGVMIFEGDPLPGAPELGTVQLGDRTVPLIGVRMNFARIEDPRCPLFPAPEPR